MAFALCDGSTGRGLLARAPDFRRPCEKVDWPVDADRPLAEVCAPHHTSWRPARLLLQRACGLRIGELLDIELDCVHEVPGQGAWLKVPLGKLDSERMVNS